MICNLQIASFREGKYPPPDEAIYIICFILDTLYVWPLYSCKIWL